MQPSTELPMPAGRGYDEHWAGGWICLLITVYLCGAAVHALMRWLAYGATCELAGLGLSGLLTWIAYSRTLSDTSIQPLGRRVATAVLLLAAWALLFPLVMWASGFR
ncbi:MAG TPA: hypothetical protein PLP29_02455 [Candidatus Ozemobacteraceae bacterium]|nr:hypothetical protein [Candidatus Ozemobacteraceae bacterium]